MLWIVLVGFLPSDHGRSCKAHPYGCGNVFIEEESGGVGRLIRLRLVRRPILPATRLKMMARMVVAFVLLLESTQLGILRANLTVPF